MMKLTTIFGLVILLASCSSEIKVDSAALATEGPVPFALDQSIVRPLDTVNITGFNFSSDMRVQVNGEEAVFSIDSPERARVTIPETVTNGKIDIQVFQGETLVRTFSLFSMQEEGDLPVATIDPAQVCRDVSFIDRDGKTVAGTRDCGANGLAGGAALCTQDGETDCLVAGEFRAGRSCTDLGSNCYLESYSLIAQPKKAVDLTALTPGILKNGVSFAGVSGNYPSASYPLVVSDAVSDLVSGTFNSQITSSSLFAWFDRNGSRYTHAGSSDLVEGNVALGTTIFGVAGGIRQPDVWDVRAGTAFGHGLSGKLKYNCRNAANLSTVNFNLPRLGSYANGTTTATVVGNNFSNGSVLRVGKGLDDAFLLNDRDFFYMRDKSGDSFQLSVDPDPAGVGRVTFNENRTDIYFMEVISGAADAFDSILPLTTYTNNPWSSSDFLCSGLEVAAGDSNVWKDVSDSPTACSTGGDCRLKDKISGQEWTKMLGNMHYYPALLYCENLVYDGENDWRIPSVYELQSASVHGMATVAQTHWIPSADMNFHFWTSTTVNGDDPAVWTVNPYINQTERPWKNTGGRNVSCVRP